MITPGPQVNEDKHDTLFKDRYPQNAVASWVMRSSPDRVVRSQALFRDIMLYSWARHFTLQSASLHLGV